MRGSRFDDAWYKQQHAFAIRRGGMTTQRRGLHDDLRTTHTKKQPTADKYPARRFPIQHEIRQLEDELNSFNERIAELEDEGHRGHAMEVLKANAIDFARRIDELRCVLVESSPKDAPRGKS
jgi:predicted  nucleic acid-binding Zn-ribbon protein